ncbi:hypothetical protein J2Y45_001721 [Dyadobacter sp. BE34]|uniref:PsbP C-terminal domain-containing protein n=1 Tax=Dyadobacter fermentans TaxID=94254 RepID=A0ABU1QTH5_9BACT|nr:MULTISPECIES: hypothetical protein [Dyadobacter]MDR6804453.1 hypothetical protein [Dyadobacter fermentans]MDR7042193.1 hypothetical protein [Dyadobacter sp. BE242]MDR7196595.1 hypothetical protein [Dyadobacter sp. BE34]MDR7212859.1 hypothetical protein [Dyadobacter sp. BE31]MDR7262002.1 hypothetical protein [Dyadobacter sp. BE32]
MKMILQSITLVIASLLLASVQSFGQNSKPAVNYMGIPGPIVFQKKSYPLKWSSHPDASLYKQEYLVAGDDFPNYKSMITIDFVVATASVDDAVRTKLRELDQLKKTLNVNYEVIGNAATGEKIIDCLLGQTAADDSKSIYEYDVYRFKAITAKSGQKGILLYALSNRAYGKDIQPFLTRLKTERKTLIAEVAKTSVPEITIKK